MEFVLTGLIENVFFWTLLVSLFGGYFTLRLANNYRDQAAFVQFPDTPARFNRRARILLLFFFIFLAVTLVSLSIIVYQALQVSRFEAFAFGDPTASPTLPAADLPTATSGAPTIVFSTATPRPTQTPSPTLEPTVETLLIARIGNTDYQGVNLRAIPSLEGDIVARLANRTEVEVINSPTVTADGYTWQQVRMQDGTEGWLAEQFLIVLPTPIGG